MKKTMSDYEFFCVLMLFLAGGVSVVGKTSAWRDDWLIHLLLPVVSVPLCMAYIALARRGRAGFCMELAFGEVAGRVALLALCAVALLVSGAVLNVYVDYVAMTPMVAVNRWFTAAAIGALCYALARCPLGPVARLSRILLPAVLVMLAAILVISSAHADLGNLLPVAEPGVKALAKDAWSLLLLQTAPAFFFILQAGPQMGGESRWPRAALLAAAGIAVVIGLVRAKNVAVLGWPLVAAFRFPSNAASSVLELGEIFERFEFLTSCALAICQPVSAALCVRFAEKSLTSLTPRLSPKLCAAVMAATVAAVAALPREGGIIEAQAWYARVTAISLVALPLLALMVIAVREKIYKNGRRQRPQS